ncbi:hypothetical protein AB0C12_40140 [Actinoplanes sp. NPDC048967]|uniref:hypothetical protein n=1 Tax=Actinoplanes sp. NPDC048967 TaxID=3155269 RepID=UPI0033F5EE90
MRPHRTDGISLSFGLLFLLVAAWWAIAQVVTVRLPAAGWLVAGALIMFGAIGLLGAIRSGRRTEVPAPVQAEAQVETPGDLPPDLHADIVRELLDNPADRVDLHPAYLKHPVPDPATGTRPASAPPAAPTSAAPSSAPPAAPTFAPPVASASAPPAASASAPPAPAPALGSVDPAGDEPTAPLPPAGAEDEPTTEVTRVDLGQDTGHDGRPGDGPDEDQDGAPRRG